MEYFGLDAAGVGALASCYYWIYAFMQIPAGILIDKFSVRIIATASVATCASGIFLFISTSNCYVAGLGQALLGFGASFSLLAAFKVVTILFPVEEISIKICYTFAICGLGPIVGGPAVSALIKNFSWIDLIRSFAILGLFLSILVWFILKGIKSPLDVKQKNIPTITSLKMILSSRQAWILAALTVMQYAPMCSLGDLWGTSFIKKAYGVDQTIASLINNMLYVGTMIGAPLFAHLAVYADSYKKPMIFGVGLSTICVGIVIFCSNLSIEAVFCLFFLIGFSAGATMSFPIVIAMFPPTAKATASGFVNMASMLGGVILMPLIGYIIDLSWSGAVENGIRVYDVADFKLGLIAILVFLAAGILLLPKVEDRSPREKEAE
jgi:MFS family permease